MWYGFCICMLCFSIYICIWFCICICMLGFCICICIWYGSIFVYVCYGSIFVYVCHGSVFIFVSYGSVFVYVCLGSVFVFVWYGSVFSFNLNVAPVSLSLVLHHLSVILYVHVATRPGHVLAVHGQIFWRIVCGGSNFFRELVWSVFFTDFSRYTHFLLFLTIVCLPNYTDFCLLEMWFCKFCNCWLNLIRRYICKILMINTFLWRSMY